MKLYITGNYCLRTRPTKFNIKQVRIISFPVASVLFKQLTVNRQQSTVNTHSGSAGIDITIYNYLWLRQF
ncbi:MULTISPECIES: hypothetical protein [unclassified Microcoleus]|uniref:hypothetical protein n=1 Tax=unclassified Microcoleus TaxID=2642155 RepID=UPI002FD19E57